MPHLSATMALLQDAGIVLRPDDGFQEALENFREDPEKNFHNLKRQALL